MEVEIIVESDLPGPSVESLIIVKDEVADGKEKVREWSLNDDSVSDSAVNDCEDPESPNIAVVEVDLGRVSYRTSSASRKGESVKTDPSSMTGDKGDNLSVDQTKRSRQSSGFTRKGEMKRGREPGAWGRRLTQRIRERQRLLGPSGLASLEVNV